MKTIILLAALLSAPGYPHAPTSDAADVFHGVTVADPYRPLEDLASAVTQDWVRAQDTLTREWTNGAHYQALRKRIEELSDFDRLGVPLQGGERLFYTTTRGLDARPVLHVEEPDGRTRVLVDANALAGGVTLAGFWPSADGELLAYGVAAVGSSWSRARIVRVDDGRHLPETLTGFRAASLAWLPDSSGFFYTRHDPPAAGEELTWRLSPQQIRFHRPGNSQENDLLVFENREQPAWSYSGLTVTADGAFLVIQPRDGSTVKNRVYYKDLRQEDAPIEKLIDNGAAAFGFLGNRGRTWWFQTDHGAARSRIVKIDLDRPDARAWTEVIPERSATLYFTSMVGERLLTVHVEDARHVARMFDLDGKFLRDIPMPDLGTFFSGFVARPASRFVYFNFGSISRPSQATVFRLDLNSGKTEPFRQPRLPFDPSDFTTTQVFFKSKDGTRVPMFIATRKGFRRNGSAPVYLYGYGAFGWVASPWFQPHVLAWMEMGGAYAMVNTRGGGEYGEEWRVAGIGRKRQNAIDDFVAAAEYLIANRYTSKSRLVANGGSASAPLAATAIVQRPDLFGASLLDIPVFDLLRYDRFTGGRRWLPDFGSPQDAEDFRALRAVSPYHLVESGTCYPATFVSAGEKDETAVPSHAYKFIARMQAAQSCGKPILLLVAPGAGHSLGTNAKTAADTMARQLAFVWKVTGARPAKTIR